MRQSVAVARVLGPAALSVLALAYLASVFDVGAVLGRAGRIPAWAVAASLALIAVNQFLSSVRFHLLLRDLGFRQSFAEGARANVYSIVGGLMLFSYFGQSLTRSAVLKTIDHSPAVAFLITGIERAVSFGLLLVLAGGGAVVLFGGVRFGIAQGGGNAIVLVIGLAIALAAMTLFGLHRSQRSLLRRQVARGLLRSVLRAGVITVGMHLTMLAAYVVVARYAAPEAALADLTAVTGIVMLAAAIPISFAGWGIRELGAAHAYRAIGLSPEAGVAMAVVVGLLSLGALALNLALTMVPARRAAGAEPAPEIARGLAHDYARLTAWLVPMLATALVSFRVPIPTGSGAINVNPADPIAIVGAVILLGLGWRQRLGGLWRIRYLGGALVLASAAMGLGFLHGWFRFGLVDWALYNRLIGWGVLLAFLATGALATAVAGGAGTSTVVRVFSTTSAAMVVADLALRWLGAALGVDLFAAFGPRLVGMTGNPNAFALQLLLALALTLPAPGRGQSTGPGRGIGAAQVLELGLLLAGLWMTASRAGFIAGAALVLAYWGLGWMDWRRLARGVAAALPIFLLTVASGVGPGDPGLHGIVGVGFVALQADRVVSLLGGLRMWLDHPLFGAGLGAFIESQIRSTGQPLVIHNSFLWLAAEFGLAGFAAFALAPLAILRTMAGDARWRAEPGFVMTAGCLVVLAAMAMAHDLVYARGVWLLLGALLAVPRSLVAAGYQSTRPPL